jgi:subtilisin family serine protease
VRIPVALATATLLVIAIPQPVMAQPSVGGPAPAATEQTTESPTGLWIVQLDEAPVATYAGGVPGLAATSPEVTGERRLDVAAPASVAYHNHLAGRQATLAGQINTALGRQVAVERQYLNVLNAMVVRVNATEAAELAGLPGVAGVYRDVERELATDVSHDLIGSASFWDGETGLDFPTRGEGVVVGVIDTGVNPAHPSFAAVDGEGYVHQNPYGSGTFVGVCDPAHPAHEAICNDKLIGAWNLHPDSPNAQDANGHGSHTGSTAAGNVHDAVFSRGGTEFTRTIRGVAPRANVISYLVCFPSCPDTSIVAAVEQSIQDGVDVLNYSITGSDDPWNDPVSLAFLDAFAAGIFVSAAAANAGPGAGTINNTGPWNATVAATTTNRVIAHDLDVTAPAPVPPALVDLAATPSDGGPVVGADIQAQIRFVASNANGCAPFAAGTFTGRIALIQRGTCTFPEKVNNAAAAGAVAVVVFNNAGGPPIFMSGLEDTTTPGVFLDLAQGTALRDFAVANPTAQVRIAAGTQLVFNDDWQDVVAGFSSRGPSQFELLNPTFAAPGVNVLAAGAANGGDPNQYLIINGTSMATPHGAGSGALMVAQHPNWSPAAIRSALASTTHDEGLRKEDGVTPADPFDVGSGRLDLVQAGRVGLVMDETVANFEAANPDTGGDPKTLNLPSAVNMECVDVCSWTRTVRSVATMPATYTAVVDAPAGMTVTVDPPQFTLVPGTLDGATQDLEITVDVSGLPASEWAFADVSFETTAQHPDHGDFVQLGEVDGPIDSWTARSQDLRAYEGQEVCLGFSYTGFDAHNWAVDDVLVQSDAGVHINESFTDAAFPPAGWSRFDFDGVGQQWARTTAVSNTPPASGRHSFSTSGGVVQDGWLVSPTFTLGENASFTYADHTAFLDWYVHSGVWISTEGCNPTPTAGPPVSAVHYPIAVQREAIGAQITVDPDEITAVQEPGQVTTHEVTIGNAGDVDLDWSVFEQTAQRLPRHGTTQVSAEARPQAAFGRRSLAPQRRLLGGTFGPVAPSAPVNETAEESPAQPGAVTITHSASQDIVAGNSVACSPDGGVSTTENGYLRHFTLSDFDISSDFAVTEVQFGIENLTVAQTVAVNLYTMINPGGPFTYANFQEIGTANASLGAQQSTIVSVPVTGTAPAGSTLVVEIDAPDASGVGGFFVGSNPNGQTAPSYLRSASCGLTEPTDTATIGFPGMHIVMNVSGNADVEVPTCDVPSGTPWVDVAPLSGTVTPGGNQVMSVTFDSTGFAGGEVLEADLCLASNDPDDPLVSVSLTLEVEAVEAPAIEVTPESLAAEQPEGTVTEQSLNIGNTGTAPLEWDIGAPAPPSPREALLRQGVLLVPDSTGDRVMAFDTQTGDLIDADFIPFNEAAGLETPIEVILTADQRGFLLSDQVADVVHAYDLDGNWLGVFAPAGGADTSIVDNMRGIALSPSGTLLVTVAAGGNTDAVAEFDASGQFAGNFIDNAAGGLNGPWDLAFRDGDVLVGASDSGAIHRYLPDGTPDGVFHSPIPFPEQLRQQANGNLLAAQFSGSNDGVWEIDAGGALLGIYSGVGGNRGVYDLPNGNVLTTNGGGVHEINRGASLVETKITGVGARFITFVQTDAPDCDTDIPWLTVSPDSGTTPAGESSEVTVSFDSTGLEPGGYEATLCVNSNDPVTPIVEVPVALTVLEDEVICDQTIFGVHNGPLTVSDGVTCLAAGSQVLGEVNVLAGAGLIGTAAVVQGPVSAVGASVVELRYSQVTGPVLISGTTGGVSLFASQVTGSVSLLNSSAVSEVAGNTIIGSLSCFGNQPPPTDHGLPNTATGGKLGQCAEL